MHNYFPYAMYLGVRLAETLSVQIRMCAVGKLGCKTDFGSLNVIQITRTILHSMGVERQKSICKTLLFFTFRFYAYIQ